MGRIVLAVVVGAVIAYVVVVTVRPSYGYCHVHAGLPDGQCTTGAIAVRQRQSVCSPSFRRVFRVHRGARGLVYLHYGIPDAVKPRYEIDLLVPGALGGSTNRENLWPLPRRSPITVEKQRLMTQLRSLVCAGKLPLGLVQHRIQRNWRQAAHLLSPTKR